MLITTSPASSSVPIDSTLALSLVELNADHPGFRDPRYRRRREQIARDTTLGRPIVYSRAEHGVWSTVYDTLVPLLWERACEPIRRGLERSGFERSRIPSLEEVSRRTESATGFRIRGVDGLVCPQDFFKALASRIFVATQYVRHPSRPWYTPEPDVLHEYFGHVPGLLDPTIAELTQAFGIAAVTQPERLEEIARVYWHSMEFGLVMEGDTLKVLGAGLASSRDELRACSISPTLQPFDPVAMAQTPFDPTDHQPVLFVGPSFASVRDALLRWLDRPWCRVPLRSWEAGTNEFASLGNSPGRSRNNRANVELGIE